MPRISENKFIKVDKKIKPIHFKLRKEPSLKIGSLYFVSFGMNRAKECILLEITERGEGLPKSITIGIIDNSGRGYGNIHSLFGDEIGLTPEEAVINTMTS